MFRIACLVIGYLIGCIQSAYFVGRAMKVDIRKHGSGSLGTTNALRVLGKRAGAMTFVCDILKSVFAFIICYKLFSNSIIAGTFASFGTVIGHDFPFYLKFKGGKGIAATIGLVLTLSVLVNPYLSLITYGIGIFGVVVSNTISLGSLLFSISIPIACFILNFGTELTLVTAIMGFVAIYRHKDNIVRLKNKNENKFIKKKG